MGKFDKGVRYYTSASYTVHFPEDDCCCKWCPMMGVEMASGRHYCRVSGEILLASDTMIGHDCPLKFEEVENGEVPFTEGE